MRVKCVASLRLATIARVCALAVMAVACADGAGTPTTPSASAAPNLPATVAKSSPASSPQSGRLTVTKECFGFTGLAGSFCTITSSDLNASRSAQELFTCSQRVQQRTVTWFSICLG
jgi:hypothetical protein